MTNTASVDLARLGFSVDSEGIVKGTHDLDKMDAAGKRVEKQSKTLGGVFSGLRGLIAGIGLGALATDTFRASASMESMTASLKTVTGSIAAAKEALGTIKDFAATTPFALEQSVQAFVKLKALGLDPSIEAMRSYGNTAAAMGKDLNQMIEAVADAATGEFERLKEFGIKAKTQGDQVSFTFQGVTTTVGKNAAEIEAYLRQIGDVNFAGAMSDQMNTLGGVLSNLRDAFFQLQVKFMDVTGIGDSLKSAMRSLSGVFYTLMDAMDGNSNSAILNDLGAAFSFLFDLFKGAINVLGLAFTGFNNLYESLVPLREFLFAKVEDFTLNSALGEAVTKSQTLTGIIDVLKGVFTDTKLVGIAFVEGILVGFEHIVGFSKKAGETIKLAFTGSFDLVFEVLATALKKLGEGLNFLKDGAGDALLGVGQSISNIMTPLDNYQDKIDQITQETEANIKAHKLITGEMADYEISLKRATKEVVELNTKTATTVSTTGDFADVCEATADELKEMAKYMREADKASDELARTLGYDLLRSQEELNRLLDNGEIYAENYATALKQVHEVLVSRGLIAGTEEYTKALELLGFKTDEAGDKTTKLGKLWEQTTDSMYSAMEQFFYDGLDGWDSFADSIKDTFKRLIASLLAQWAASGIAGLFNGQGFSGFSFSNAFQGGVNFGGNNNRVGNNSKPPSGGGAEQMAEALGLTSQQAQHLAQGAGGVVNIYGGVQNYRNGNEVGGAIQAASGAVDTYNAYQGLTGGAQLGGYVTGGLGVAGGAFGLYTSLENGDYMSAAINAYQTYNSAQTLIGAYQAASAGLGQASAANLAQMGITQTPATTTAATSAWGPAASAAGWVALAIAADQLLLDGAVGDAGFDVWDERKNDFDGGIEEIAKSQLSLRYPKLFLKSLFGGQGTDSLGREQLGEVFKSLESGRAQALQLTPDTTFLGGFNDETTFFDTGLESEQADRVAKMIQERLGFSDVREIADGILRLEDLGGSFEADADNIIGNVLASIAEVKIGFTDVERSIAKSMGDTFLDLDKGFDMLVANGMDSTKALTKSISDFYGKSEEEANAWIENSGFNAERLIEIFSAANGQVLDDVINTFGTAEGAVTDAFGAMTMAANDSAYSIMGGFENVASYAEAAAARAANSFTVQIGNAQAAAARAGEETNALLREQTAAIRETNNKLETVAAKQAQTEDFIQQQTAVAVGI